MAAGVHFTPTQRATLKALARAIVSGAPASNESIDVLVDRIDARIATVPPHRRAMLAKAIDAMGGRAAVAIGTGQPRRYTNLSAQMQADCLRAWGRSKLPPLRSAYQSVRSLVLSVHYARTEVSSAVGYAGPLAGRAPQAEFEGPLPGEQRADEPIARGARSLPTAIAADPHPTGVISGRQVERDTHRSADVVVIGSGAGGAVAAERLSSAGFDVVMLEGGSYHARSDFTEDEPLLMERLYADGALRTTDDASFGLLQGQTVGGSSTVNWMIMLRTPEHVLEEWTREHGLTDASASQLRAAFDRIERETQARDVPDDAHSANNRLILDGARTLGWRAATARINANECVRCGFCGIGCRHDAKQSVVRSYLPTTLARGATLHTDTYVQRIERIERESGRGTPALKRVHAIVEGRQAGRPPRLLTIDAPLVVVAGGAIETPALLQRSGLGGGGVGSWLRLHPTTVVSGVYDRDILSNTGIPLSTICDEYSRWNGTDYGFWIECPPMHPSMMAAVMPGFGDLHAQRMRQFRQLGAFVVLTRDGANRLQSNGRVATDRAGRTSIQYRLGREDQRRVRAGLEAGARIHLAAGAREVFSLHATPVTVRSERDVPLLSAASLAPNRIGMFSAHVNGTCRMGTDPSTSGATPDGERHAVRGLYISDGSLLPTAPGVNPQETIMALASVLAERWAAQHAGMQHV